MRLVLLALPITATMLLFIQMGTLQGTALGWPMTIGVWLVSVGALTAADFCAYVIYRVADQTAAEQAKRARTDATFQ